jgi:DNA-binding winged helix-turn-helix (wHTH) protein/predicted ATPase
MIRPSHYDFGAFRVDAVRRLLLRGGEPVPLTARTFDTLLALLERRGEMIEKETLMTAVWGDTTVEESNLTQQISLLRKALGEQPNQHAYIATVPRRGYRFVAPVRITTASGEAVAPSRQRFVVGRKKEQETLASSFHAAAAGGGRLVCLAGEPGIGKSTIGEEFLARFSSGELQGWVARGRCSERLAGTDAYLPILEALDSLLAASAIDAAPTIRDAAPAWWALLRPSSLSGDAAPPSSQRLKRELTNLIAALAAASPGVLFLDDLQWADASTTDALGYLATRLESIGVLILCTYRPAELLSTSHPFLGLKLDLQARGICTDLQVPFLTREDVAAYLELELAPYPFPGELPDVIHGRTEGNPLFLTDLVRDMRARGILTLRDDRWMLTRAVPEVEAEWPQSVRSMVERAIARVGEEELKVLRAGSAQGLEFDSVILARALQADVAEIEERLDRAERRHGLVRQVSEVRLPSGEVTTRYAFVHVLYQNAVYATLPRARRAALSGSVGDALRHAHGGQSPRIAQQLAALYSAADRPREAVTEFHLAAQQALAVGGAREAVRLTRHALDLLPLLPAGEERDQQELALLIILGVPLAATTGYANPEVEQTYTRMRALASARRDHGAQFAALWGLWVTYHVSGKLTSARAIAAELVAAGEHSGDARVLEVAHTVSAYTTGHMGELHLALDHLRQAAAHFRPEHLPFFASVNALPPTIAGPAHEGRVLWLVGQPDAALARAAAALALARQTGSPNAIGFALVYLTYVHQMRNEPDAVLERTGEALALAAEHGLADVMGWATVWRGWALAQRGDVQTAIASMRHALAAQRSFGSEIARPHQLALLAEVLLQAGTAGEARMAIEEGLAHVERTGDRYYEPELYRLRGELARLEGRDGDADFAAALRSAQAMKAEGFVRRLKLRRRPRRSTPGIAI